MSDLVPVAALANHRFAVDGSDGVLVSAVPLGGGVTCRMP
jgi:hypothetical protein